MEPASAATELLERDHCPNAEALKRNPERFTPVAWEGDTSAPFRVELQIDGWDRTRMLEDLSRTFAETGINILEARCTVVHPMVKNRFVVEVGDTQALKTCIARLRNIESVFDAYRVTPAGLLGQRPSGTGGRTPVHGNSLRGRIVTKGGALAVLVATGVLAVGIAAVASGQTSDYYPQCDPIATNNTIVGNGGNNVLDGTPAKDLILAFGGNDTADGQANRDCLLMGTGNDRATGSGQGDRVFGEQGNDRVAGGEGNDRVDGDSGQDRVGGNPGRDDLRVDGDSGRDTVSGGPGADRVIGGASRGDELFGRRGNDRLNAVDNVRDATVNCGPGQDRARIDFVDPVSRNCEVVFRVP